MLHNHWGVIRRSIRFFYKDSTPSRGFQQTSSFRRKPFSLRLISSGGKMDRMPSTCAMGLALECFQKIIPSKGMIFWKIFPTTRHSIHVRMIVRKATLNGPKRLRIRVVSGIRELLRRFGYFCASKVTMRSVILKWTEALRIRVGFGMCELLRRFWLIWAPKVTKDLCFVFFLH
ncbi:hypothetical protein [Sphingobacterium sp.]|uniref:hypothetical protein n=1 Tax=Sphingobacterium sp. TaxID=341027 RepID=UPI0028A972CD|nr:hypothetical protein [Sphingobacterium sp.]